MIRFKANPTLKGYALMNEVGWLKNSKILMPQQEARLAALKRPDLGTTGAYQIKLALTGSWEIVDPEEAVSYLKL